MNGCERACCDLPGRSYQRCGQVVQTPAVGFNTSTAGPFPEHPITLCSDHALEAFGWSLL